MHPQAALAVHAARHAHIWGAFAAARYCARRSVHPRLYLLAMSLQTGA